jgi:hypothetical protein
MGAGASARVCGTKCRCRQMRRGSSWTEATISRAPGASAIAGEVCTRVPAETTHLPLARPSQQTRGLQRAAPHVFHQRQQPHGRLRPSPCSRVPPQGWWRRRRHRPRRQPRGRRRHRLHRARPAAPPPAGNGW